MMRYILIYALFFAMRLSATVSWHAEAPGNFSVEITIPKTRLELGELIDIHVKAKYPNTYTLDIEKLKSNLMLHNIFKAEPFIFVSAQSDVKKVENSVVNDIHFHLKSQLDGQFYISLYDIEFTPKNESDKPVTIISNLFEIHVEQPNIDVTVPALPRQVLLSLSDSPPIQLDLNNYAKLIDNPESKTNEIQRNVKIAANTIFPWPEILISIIALLFFVLVYMNPPYKPSPALPFRIILGARDKALKKLEGIKSKRPEPTEFYVELTDTLRNYIEEYYQMPASSYTTEEFLHEAIGHPEFSPKMREDLKQFLVKADRVKFASHLPSQEECEQAEQAAKNVMKE